MLRNQRKTIFHENVNLAVGTVQECAVKLFVVGTRDQVRLTRIALLVSKRYDIAEDINMSAMGHGVAVKRLYY